MQYRDFFYRLLSLILLLSSKAALMASSSPTEHLSTLSLSQLEHELAEVDARLKTLAHYTPRGGLGHVGYRSVEFDGPDHIAAVRIDLPQRTTIDQIVLVPTIIRDSIQGFRPDGFPKKIRILDDNGATIASRDYSNEYLQRIAPFKIPLTKRSVSSITIEASNLSPRAFDQKFFFQLAEVLIFNELENVALGCPVQESTPQTKHSPAWNPIFLTDGALPYLMNSAQGNSSLAYISPRKKITDETLRLSVDLEHSYPLTQLHLHTVDQSDTIPQAGPSGIGMPRRLVVEGANQADFSDAQTLLEVQCPSSYEANPIMMWPLAGQECRYLRLVAAEPYMHPFLNGLHQRIGFAEITILSHGHNVSAAKVFQVPGEQKGSGRKASSLTDCRNIFGQTLPIRQWIEELTLRHELESKRPLIIAELTRRYANQKKNLRIMIWVATLLAIGIAFTILVNRMLRMRKVAHLKERFAADLHDELGANLHTIGLLSQLARRKMETSAKDASNLLAKIDSTTKRTSIAMKNIAALQTADGLYTNLENDMEQAAERILVNTEHKLHIEQAKVLSQLKPRTQLDLYLFFQECLINISRHAKASKANTYLTFSHTHISLRVTDDGRGMLESEIPSSLKSRAKLLNGTIRVSPHDSGGACVELTFKSKKRLIF